jgi:parallel beta-helix repeat protein
VGRGFRGIYIYQAGRPTIERCDISRTGDDGISVAHQSAPVIRESWVHDTQGVGLMFGRGCGGTVEDCRLESAPQQTDQLVAPSGAIVRARQRGDLLGRCGLAVRR